MNTQIKELAKHAQTFAEWHTPQGLEWFPMFKEKFAELIVRECAEIANAGIDPTESHLIGDDILQHFELKG